MSCAQPDLSVDLSADEARLALTDIEWRRAKNSSGSSFVEVFYNGRWRRLLREDLHREVCSWTEWCGDRLFHENPVEWMRGTIMYGARLRDDAFIIIDDTTDH